MNNQYVTNILRYFERAEGTYYQDGMNWYLDAHNHIQHAIAIRFGVSTETACGVVAALSPQNPWNHNLRDAATVFEAVQAGLNEADVKVSTFNDNKAKAFRIARGESPTDVLGGNKVTAFYANLSDPLHSEAVTVDRWAFRIATGQEYTKIPAKLYRELEAAYRTAAETLGIQPHQVQSVTWCCIRGAVH